MIYYLKKENTLEEVREVVATSILPYPNIQDTRNYAFIYIYPNNQIDAVIRTYNLNNHTYAIAPLLNKSPNLTFLKSYQVDDPIHYDMDFTLAKNGALVIYYSNSNLQEEFAFGDIYMPDKLTDFQKNFLITHRVFLETYAEILINQYSTDKQNLIELNEYGDGTFLKVLDQITGYVPSISYHQEKRK